MTAVMSARRTACPRGVRPLCVVMLGFAPALSRASMALCWPLMVAYIRGVNPFSPSSSRSTSPIPIIHSHASSKPEIIASFKWSTVHSISLSRSRRPSREHSALQIKHHSKQSSLLLPHEVHAHNPRSAIGLLSMLDIRETKGKGHAHAYDPIGAPYVRVRFMHVTTAPRCLPIIPREPGTPSSCSPPSTGGSRPSTWFFPRLSLGSTGVGLQGCPKERPTGGRNVRIRAFT